MKKNIIIHIPHASLNLPNIFYKKLNLDKEYIEKENIFLSDYLVDKLLPTNTENVLKFNYSRLFCDIERFLDDTKEPMSKIGMGVIYTKDSNNNEIIKIDNEYKNEVINNYYLPFHKLIDDTTLKVINNYQECYFIDLHSFSDNFVEKVFNKSNNPDICIGFDKKYIDNKFLNYTINYFKDKGYSIKLNYPYEGVLIPNIILINSKYKINAIMLEINKRTYLDNNLYINKDKFNKLKKCLKEYLEYIEK